MTEFEKYGNHFARIIGHLDTFGGHISGDDRFEYKIRMMHGNVLYCIMFYYVGVCRYWKCTFVKNNDPTFHEPITFILTHDIEDHEAPILNMLRTSQYGKQHMNLIKYFLQLYSIPDPYELLCYTEEQLEYIRLVGVAESKLRCEVDKMYLRAPSLNLLEPLFDDTLLKQCTIITMRQKR